MPMLWIVFGFISLGVVAISGILAGCFASWEVLLYSVISLEALFLAYFLIMVLYFHIKRHTKTKRMTIEAGFIVTTFVIGYVIRFCFEVTSLDSIDWKGVVIAALRSVFGTFGHYGFEGLSDVGEGVKNVWTAIAEVAYPASSIISALVFISLLSFQFGFEFFSFLQFAHSPRTLYIFTELNRTSFDLAKDIVKQYGEDRKKIHIIFSGPNLESFDRHNILCNDAENEGFLYWSYPRKSGKTLNEILRISKHSKGHRHVIFACNEEDWEPKESKNLGFVEREIEGRLSRKDDCWNMEYVILGSGDIQMASYDNEIAQLKKKIEDKYGKDNASNFGASISVWNKTRQQAMIASTLIRETVCDRVAEKNVNLWCLGFGAINQQLAAAAVSQAFVNKNGGIMYYNVFAFDGEADSIVGSYSHSHPLVSCANTGDDALEMEEEVDRLEELIEEIGEERFASLISPDFENETEFTEYFKQRLLRFKAYEEMMEKEAITYSDYASRIQECIKQNGDINGKKLKKKGGLIQLLKEEMKLPRVYFSSADCMGEDFMKRLLRVTDVKPKNSDAKVDTIKRIAFEADKLSKAKSFSAGKRDEMEKINASLLQAASESTGEDYFAKEGVLTDIPDVISISTGDDKRNVLLANSVIRQTSEIASAVRPKLLLIHITKKSTAGLLIGHPKDDPNVEKKIPEELEGYFNTTDICGWYYLAGPDLLVAYYGYNESFVSMKNVLGRTKEDAAPEAALYNASYDALSETIGGKEALEKTFDEWIGQIQSVQAGGSADAKLKSKKIKEVIEAMEAKIQSRYGGFKYVVGMDTEKKEDGEVYLGEYLENIKSHALNVSAEKAIRKWAFLDILKKESSYQTSEFRSVYKRLLRNYETSNQKDAKLFDASWIEKQRWNRFQIMNGFKYGQTKELQLGHHNCLIPGCLINSSDIRYDIYNVIMSYCWDYVEK